MDELQQEIFDAYKIEVEDLCQGINVGEDGEHLWDNYQRVTAILFRLQELHNDISFMEITGRDWPEIKKLRTLVIDPTIDQLKSVAQFESRKITGKQMEKDLERY